jgi:ATP-binding cassette, subfamily B, bacterial PglK
MIFRVFKGLFMVMDEGSRRSFLALQFLILFSALLEFLSVMSIAPFIYYATASQADKSSAYDWIYQLVDSFMSIVEFDDAVLLLGLFVLFLVILSSMLSIYSIFRMSLFGASLGTHIGNKLYSYYINNDVQFHYSRHSSVLVKNISIETTRITNGIIIPVMVMFSKIITSIFMIVAILSIDILIGSGLFLSVSLLYIVIFFIVRPQLLKNGRYVSESSASRLKLMVDGFSAIREIILSCKHKYFYDRFVSAGNVYSRSLGVNQALGLFPKFLVELFALVIAIVFMIIGSGVESNDVQYYLPQLGLLIFASLKLIPSLQVVYVAFTGVKSHSAAYKSIEKDLYDSVSTDSDSAVFFGEYCDVVNAPVVHHNSSEIYFNNVNFIYNGFKEYALSDATFKLSSPSAIAFSGPSGSGKSTIVDLILGLLTPSSGSIEIKHNGLTITDKSKLSNIIGYVPQKPYFGDFSVLENVAFGVDFDLIDRAQVFKSCRLAEIHDFIRSLPFGFDTKLGESGVKLSGGQLQRIAIARALYHDPDMLIFDEATSALDVATEISIMNSIYKLSKSRLIVIVAHRIATLANCDKIYYVDSSRIVDSGDLPYLSSKYPKIFKVYL